MEISKQILELLEDLRPTCDFQNSDNFIDDGYLNSFDVIMLISELEDKFSIVIDGLDVVPENFSSIQKIIEIIQKSGGKVC